MTKETQEKMTRETFLVAQRCVLYNTQTKKFCVAKVANTKSGFYKKYGPWDIFGGHIDAGEAVPEDAMRRELKEEAGVEALSLEAIGAIDFSGYGENGDDKRQRILIGYVATCDTEEITLSSEHSAYEWFSADDILQHKKIKQWIKDFVTMAQARLREHEALAGWQRCVADFDNYKKRQAESAKSNMQYATENMITKLLPILDNFHASIEHVPAEHAESPWVMGLGYIQKQLADALTESGMVEMQVAVGDVFDPMKHEAIKAQNDGADEEGDEKENDTGGEQKIAKVVTRGYMMGDKVIRPARVVVK